MITVEKATERDIDAVREIDSTTIGGHKREKFLTGAVRAGRCFVAQDGNAVVGFGVLEQSFFGQGFISLLVVHPEHRRRGVATAIIRHIESICPTDKLFTSTNKSNVIAQKLFEASGFVKSGYIENLDEGDPEVVYFKRLRRQG